MIKEPIYQEDIATLNVYASNTRVQNKWNTLIKLKGKIEKSTIIVGNFNILLLEIGRNSRKSACKDLK